MEGNTGKLYLVATPLGNLEDITARALRILGEVDLIAAEDTRHTLKLLNHFGIKKSLISYFQHNERAKVNQIIEKLLSGMSIALVSDAGMPGISDPGNFLVAETIKHNITVIPIPGATAVITALAASGLDTGSFYFVGFLPRKTSEQTMRLKEMVEFKGTLVFYEAPHRVLKTLENIFETMGERQVVIARELTKLHEEFIRGPLSKVKQELAQMEIKGEFTLIIEGSKSSTKIRHNSTNYDIESLFMALEEKQTSLKSELKEIARQTGDSVKEVYHLYLEYKKKRDEPS